MVNCNVVICSKDNGSSVLKDYGSPFRKTVVSSITIINYYAQ
ncbi:MAG TPA: hypothetical protein VIP56_13640 [Nitrososphaeraceae archaeon]